MVNEDWVRAEQECVAHANPNLSFLSKGETELKYRLE
jgi:hypothetical protein